MTNTVQPPTQQSTPTQPATTEQRRWPWPWQRKPKKQPKTTVIAKTATLAIATNDEPTFYENAIEWCHRADKVINLALGYLLAFASVLGFMDVLSNGEVLTHVPAAFYIWLAIMGLGVDFQLFLVIGRFPDLTRQLNGLARLVFIAFNLVFLSFLCYMSATIGAVFTQHRDVANSTITGAMQSLHIDATYFVYERAALATLLLVLMAVDRTMERWRMQVSHDQAMVTSTQSAQTVNTTAQPMLSSEDLAEQIRKVLRSELAAIAQSRQDAAVQSPVQNAQNHVEITQIAHSAQQAVIAQHSTVSSEHNDDDEAEHIAQQTTQPVLHVVRSAQSSVFEAVSPAQAVQDNARVKVFTYLDAHPDALEDNVAVMDGAGVNVHAARRYRREYKAARGGAQ